jgi:hypothetical protein
MSLTACAMAQAQDAANGWNPMFDGRTLKGWAKTPFSGKGKVEIADGAIALLPGGPMTGVNWTGEFPKSGYEIRWEARRVRGNDFFSSLTFPVGDAYATWVTGGWGGDIVGMSSIGGWDASENETRSYFNFENGRWYAFLLEVRPGRVKASIDGAAVFDVNIEGREISLRRGEINRSAPLGFAAYATRGEIRKAGYRVIPAVR